MAQPKKKRAPTLKTIGASPDGSALLLARTSGAAQPAFKVALDEDLVAALEDAQAIRRAAARAKDQLELPPPIPARVESKLSIKEIQNLLRQGRTVPAIAKKAGVETAWVERWEGPIVWERAGTATRARRAYLERARGGSSRMSLGDAVAFNLKDKGLRMEGAAFDSAWDSTKKPRSERWVVSFTYTHRSREQTARWEYDPETDHLTAIDKTAGELGWVAPIRRRSRA
ncbi:MAG: hypothetical protein QOG04_1706 [Actinomycetota bacterium]|nr:hypothetical protein [Actinomycetota bacterium]